jgi:hypothetical protein
MDNKPSSLWALLILALFGSFAVLQPGGYSRTPNTPTSTSSPSPTENTAATPTTLTAPESTPKQSKATTPPPDEHTAPDLIAKYFCGKNGGDCPAYREGKDTYKIDSLIVTVPDPVESGLAGDFDNMIDVIQRAAVANDLLLDRFDLPWLTSGPSAAEHKEPPRDSNVEPGVMLFRSSPNGQNDPLELLVVYLVGETPTGGIHVTAFRSAVDQMYEIGGKFPYAALEPIKVLGPSYSGSARSLAFAIADARTDKHPCPPVTIISGGATSIDPKELVSKGDVEFHATMNPDRGVIEALRHALAGHTKYIALLSESGTSYGSGVGDNTSNAASENKCTSGQPNSNAESGKPGRSDDASLPPLVHFKFPIEIGEIEKAVAQDSPVPETNGATAALQHPTLPFGSSAGERRDLVPIFSKTSTVNTTELELENQLRFIANQSIRYVVIAATDVDDTIYLVREVRQFVPTATIISLNANILYEHGEVNPELRGLLVASSYPLFLENRLWTSSDPGEHPADSLASADLATQFPSDIAEGAYNAFQALLNQTDKMVDYSTPFEQSQRPPLWLSVVGHGGVWPVAALSVNDQGYTEPGPSQSDIKAKSPKLPLTTVIVGGFPLVAMLGLLLMFFFGEKWLWLPIPIKQSIGISEVADLRGAPRFYLVEALVIAFLLLLAFLLCLFLPGGWPGTFPASTICSTEAMAAMRKLRSMHLGDGVSPIMPMLFVSAASLVLLCNGIRRRVLMETHQLRIPCLTFRTNSFDGVSELEGKIRSASEDRLWKSWKWWLVIALALLPYFLLRSWCQPPIDGCAFEWTYLAFSAFAYGCIATATFRLVTIWLATRRLLHRLYWHPSRDGYATIHQDMPGDRDAEMNLMSPLPNLTPAEASLGYARRIADFKVEDSDKASCVLSCLSSDQGALAVAIGCTEISLREALDCAAKDQWKEQIEREHEMEEKLECVSSIVAYIFEPAWRIIDAPLPPDKDDPIKQSPLLKLGEAYVASRVARMLHRVMPHLRVLAIASTAAVLLMLFAASSYPFPASDDLLWFSWAMLVAAAGSTTWMFLSMNRDRVISLLSGTTPGALNWNSTLMVQLTTHALIPVLVLLGAQFPGRLARLMGWFGGILGAGHGG